MVKFWKKMDFWTKLKGSIGMLGIGSEVGLFIVDSAHHWKFVALGATVLGIFITYWIQDINNDGIADIFQTDKDLKKKTKKDE